MRKHSTTSVITRSHALFAAIGSFAISGCHDGPLYALKHVNPYFTMKEWREDRAFGVTDHQRRNELLTLCEQIGDMPMERQTFWSGHLNKMIDNDPSPEMRRLAINAAGKLKTNTAVGLIEKGLKDDSIKVRMEACRALGRRSEPYAAQLLASTAGSETEQDVQHAAIAAMGSHKNQIATNSLRMALSDRNPATQSIAMQSLRSVTGKNYGNKPDAWLAALDKTPVPTAPALTDSGVQVASGTDFSMPSTNEAASGQQNVKPDSGGTMLR
ncbi:MAG: HEAT repeat domain-containing protein [Pirellulaceae bacterium]|nr:HEAT repeat domain-containing protein [Pirellulaceae bacterium]